MQIELRQQLGLRQQLVMTPQLQLAIKLLQLSRLELEEHVRQEMVENPVLEEAPAAAAEDGDGQEEAPAAAAPEPATAETPPARTSDADIDRFLQNHAAEPPRMPRPERPEEYPQDHDERYAVRNTLVDHVEWQVKMGEFSDQERQLALMIVGNIDRDGYFREPPLEDLAVEVGLDAEDAEALLETIQEMDPPGIAARDLRECLLAQARVFGLEPAIVRMIDKHLPDIEKRNYAAIARAVDLDIEDVYAAAQIVATLEPRPARNFVTDDTCYVIPDLEVKRSGDEWIVVTNDDGLPRLRISRYYRDLAGRDAKARQYIREKVRSAQWLIRSINQRQNTMLRVTQRIVERQREFFEHGVAAMRPMTLKDVAEDLGMHESTIGRVTTNKYVQTPHGILELKSFFHSRIRRVDDDDISSEAVRSRIRKLVEAEDPSEPCSDQQIMRMLADSGIVIARRTVAKYREAMGVLNSSRRKKCF